MPCYTVQKMSVEFKAKHKELLRQALDSLGFNYQFDGNVVSIGYGRIVLDLDKGEAQLQSVDQSRLNQIKRAYSIEALKAVGKKNNWRVKLNGDASAKAVKGQFLKGVL